MIWIEGYFIVVVSDLNASKVVLICDRESLSIDEILWLETISNYIHLQFEAAKKLEDFMDEISRENSEKEYVNRFARLSLMISEKERGICLGIFTMAFYKISYVCIEKWKDIKNYL